MKDRTEEHRQYRIKNKERIRLYKIANRQRDLEYSRQWYHKNKDRKRITQILWRKNNPDKVQASRNRNSKKHSLKRRHGITLEYFNKIFQEQNERCAICNNGFKNEKDKCVDHCHHTGTIRSILCFNCNIGIGKFQDSIELLEKALEYLKKWQQLSLQTAKN